MQLTISSEVISNEVHEAQSFQCANSTVAKIVIFVTGLLALGAGLAMYYLNINSIASIDQIASYTSMGGGGFFILTSAIWCIVERITTQTVENLEQTEEVSKKNVSKKDKSRSWQETFKSQVLANSARSLERVPAHDLTLTREEEACLQSVIHSLYHPPWKTEKATIHSSNGVLVFSINELPGRIFKVKQPGADGAADNNSRVAASLEAQKVIEEEKLHLLHVPKQKVIQLKIGDEFVDVLIEQKFDILHGITAQESLFQYCMTDPELIPFIQECSRQLITLILKIGYADVRYDNNPLLSNGMGMGLIDLDAGGSIVTGLVTGRTATYTEGILYCLSPEMLDTLEPFLRENLNETDFNSLKLDQIKNHLIEDAKRNQEFKVYLTSQGITTGKEQVKLQGFFGSSPYIKELQENINTRAANNPGFCLTAERKFYIYNLCNPSILKQLKDEGKIFDWMDVKKRTDSNFASGYYVWC